MKPYAQKKRKVDSQASVTNGDGTDGAMEEPTAARGAPAADELSTASETPSQKLSAADALTTVDVDAVASASDAGTTLAAPSVLDIEPSPIRAESERSEIQVKSNGEPQSTELDQTERSRFGPDLHHKVTQPPEPQPGNPPASRAQNPSYCATPRALSTGGVFANLGSCDGGPAVPCAVFVFAHPALNSPLTALVLLAALAACLLVLVRRRRY